MKKLLFAACLALSLGSVGQAAVVTAVYEDGDGDSLEFTFDDATLPNAPVSSLLVNGTNVPIAGAITNDLDSVDGALGQTGGLNFNFISAGAADILLVSGGFAGTATGLFAPLNGPLTLVSIPEPSSIAGILLLSLSGMGIRRRRRPINA